MKTPLSLYIHWPYCLSLCPYCDFNSHLAGEIDHQEWLKNYKIELDFFKDHISDRKIQSIFFGGGTPSLMDPRTVEGIISHVNNICEMDGKTEITLEANPTSYEAEKFKDFKKAGINRVSLGVQSLREDRLQALGRKHSAREAINTIQSASEIFNRYSFDLIYASQGQTTDMWEEELNEASKLIRDHVSLYQLTIEKGTPFYKDYKNGNLTLPENEIATEMYELTDSILGSRGLEAYEISNYSAPGAECRHNLAYWHYDEYLGIGPGAHSRIHNECSEGGVEVTAIMMSHKPEKWLGSVSSSGNGIQNHSKLSKIELIEEILMMGLRLKEGVRIDKIEHYTGSKIRNFIDHYNLSIYEEKGFINTTNNTISLTPRGLLMHSYIVPRIISS